MHPPIAFLDPLSPAPDKFYSSTDPTMVGTVYSSLIVNAITKKSQKNLNTLLRYLPNKSVQK